LSVNVLGRVHNVGLQAIDRVGSQNRRGFVLQDNTFARDVEMQDDQPIGLSMNWWTLLSGEFGQCAGIGGSFLSYITNANSLFKPQLLSPFIVRSTNVSTLIIGFTDGKPGGFDSLCSDKFDPLKPVIPCHV
jgi:hypothetical protein